MEGAFPLYRLPDRYPPKRFRRCDTSIPWPQQAKGPRNPFLFSEQEAPCPILGPGAQEHRPVFSVGIMLINVGRGGYFS